MQTHWLVDAGHHASSALCLALPGQIKGKFAHALGADAGDALRVEHFFVAAPITAPAGVEQAFGGFTHQHQINGGCFGVAQRRR